MNLTIGSKMSERNSQTEHFIRRSLGFLKQRYSSKSFLQKKKNLHLELHLGRRQKQDSEGT